MKLDYRIDRTPFSPLDAENVASYVGDKCYFGDSLAEFRNLDGLKFAVLESVGTEDDNIKPYHSGIDFAYCLPERFVKMRTLTLEQFLNRWCLGDVKILRKNGEDIEYKFYGYQVFDRPFGREMILLRRPAHKAYEREGEPVMFSLDDILKYRIVNADGTLSDFGVERQ